MTYFIEIVRYILNGAGISLKVFAITLLLSIPLSLLIASIYLLSSKLVKRVISSYTWLFRGTPLMLQLFFIMFGLPAIGIRIDRMLVAYIGFSINYAAYFTEIIRAGIESIPKDQFEAASVEGASNYQTLRSIILPQAIRKELPTITNEVITLIKDTAIVSVIAISDLLRNVKEIVSRDFTVTPFIIAAGFYLIISWFIVKIFRYWEHKFNFVD